MTDKLREQSIEFAKKHLFECAKEILDWGRTSILCDGKLRELAKTCEAWVRDESYALGVAEAIVKEEALRAALAQQDAQAVAQPIGYARPFDLEALQNPANPTVLLVVARDAFGFCSAPIYAAPTPPAQRGCSSTSHEGLTDDEIVQLSMEWPAETNDWASHIDFARAAIEAYEKKNGINRG